MQVLTKMQFTHNNRYRTVGFNRPDLVDVIAVVRKTQAGEMKESNKVGDYVFTVWAVSFQRPGQPIRVCFQALLAEEACKLVEGDEFKFSGTIIPPRPGKSPLGWILATDFKLIKKASGEPLDEADEASLTEEELRRRQEAA